MSPSIRPLDIIPVSEVQIPFSLSVALKLYFSVIMDHQARVSLFGGNLSCFSTATLWYDSSIRTNRATVQLFS